MAGIRVNEKLCSYLIRRFSSAFEGHPTPPSDNRYTWKIPKFIDSDEDHNSATKLQKRKCAARETSKGKKEKPLYRPPSSLDIARRKPFRSDLPFDFQFSYTETPKVAPLGFREPKFSPFGPGRLDREWTGWCAPSKSIVVSSIEGNEESIFDLPKGRRREEILGAPLTKEEIQVLVDENRPQKTRRVIHLGRDGLTHNMLNNIHNIWKNVPAVRIKCLGVPTVDMKNVCLQLEDKTGGKIIYRNRCRVILFRGRNYNPKERPEIPLMLWKPHSPIYPKLVKTTIDGLSVEETKNMRKRGLKVPALIKLRKNGDYCNLVKMVQKAFKIDDLVRIDCKRLPKSDYRKIGAKLKDLVPCILVTFENNQIVMWRGRDKAFEGNQGAT